MIEPSKNLQEIFESSIETAKKLGHEYITVEHIVFEILNDKESYE
ncbi:Clp protease N-terminal domain-containing protein, partial [Loigolactobacillus coryniformis]